MDLAKQFIKIVEEEKEAELLPFLKALSKQERIALRPAFKKFNNHLMKAHPMNKGNVYWSERKATDQQTELLKVADFVLSDSKSFGKHYWARHNMTKEFLDPILPWYCPTWFSDFINNNLPHSMTYDWMMELVEAGHYTPSEPNIAEKVAASLYTFVQHTKNVNRRTSTDGLTKRAITLSEHIWFLFRYEIENGFLYRDYEKENRKDTIGNWKEAFVELIDKKLIDRTQVLKGALSAIAQQNYKRPTINWYGTLFVYLSPTEEELLALQSEVFSAFISTQSKAIKGLLKELKKIVQNSKFNVELFLDYVPVLLNSEVKSVVSPSLGLLELILKKNPKQSSDICQVLCETFIHKDEILQKKASKLITTYGDIKDEDLIASISTYQDYLLHSTKTSLSDYLSQSEAIDDNLEVFEKQAIPLLIREDNTIPIIGSFNDLVFLASQAFDNNEPYHFYLLPDAMIRFQKELKVEQIPKLLPALERAYKIVARPDRFKQSGMLDILLATFFIDFFKTQFYPKHPKLFESYIHIHEEIVKSDNDFKKKFDDFTPRLFPLEKWGVLHRRWIDSVPNSRHPIYDLFKEILVFAKKQILAGSQLPLLSTPSHSPYWLEPTILVKRLEQYQAQNTTPHLLDLQLAISRTALDNSEAGLQLVKERLEGEYLQLMTYLLDSEATPQKPFDLEDAWIVASLTKNPDQIEPAFKYFYPKNIPHVYRTGQLDWKIEYLEKSWKGYNDKIYTYHTHELTVAYPKIRKDKKPNKLIYDFFIEPEKFPMPYHNDFERSYSIVPSNPEVIHGLICNNNSSVFYEKDDWEITRVEILAQRLLNQEASFGKMAHLALADLFQAPSKTARLIAAEVWIFRVQQEEIDSLLLGENMGKFQASLYAPLKRFTDLIISDLLNISETHNKALESLVVSCLLAFPKKAPKNTKKLLEIYVELLSINNSKAVNDLLKEHFEAWKKSASLKKIIKNLSAM